MSNIIELENCPELNFIENMTLQETEDQMRELYAGYYRELTGKDPEIGDADTVNLLIKAFCAMEYQTMQYAEMCIRDRRKAPSAWWPVDNSRLKAARPASA